jgi:hypothetical protein
MKLSYGNKRSREGGSENHRPGQTSLYAKAFRVLENGLKVCSNTQGVDLRMAWLMIDSISYNVKPKESRMRLSRTVRLATSIVALGISACLLGGQEPATPAKAEPAESKPAASEAANPWNFPDFTAIQKIGPGGGRRPLLMKVYFSGSTVRVELSPKIINLFVTSTGNVYRIETYPDKTTSCLSMRRDQLGFMASPLEMLQGAKVERTPAGTDDVDGHKTKVEDVVVTRADGKIMKSKVWEADDFKGLPIKIISEVAPDPKTKPDAKPVKIGALYGDIKFEKVDPALLTPPDNCRPIEKTYKVVEQTVDK